MDVKGGPRFAAIESMVTQNCHGIVRLTAACAAIACGTSVAQALDLATFDIRSQGSGIGDVTNVRVTILDQIGPLNTPHYQLFENFSFTPADVGSTFVLTIADDPDFATFAQMLTDGANDGFGYFVDNLPSGGGVGTSWTESNLFAAGTHAFGPGNFTSIGQLSGPDFAGYPISQISLTINSFSLSSGTGSYGLDFRATAKIISVPEPGSVGMLLLGVTTLGLRRRRKV